MGQENIFGKRLEEKLKLLLDKYALKTIEDSVEEHVDSVENSVEGNVEDNVKEDDEWETDEDCLEDDSSKGEQSTKPKIDKTKYHFYYNKRDDDSFSINPNLELKKGKDMTIFIEFYTKEFSDNLREITHDADMYSDDPCIPVESLYYSINDIRIRHKEDKFNNKYVETILNFIEELFDDKYSKMDNMIKDNKIDFPSLWYYLDKIDTHYVIKHLDEEICFKHKAFMYTHDNEDKEETLILFGYILYYWEDSLDRYEVSHRIPRFQGTKDLDSLKIKVITDDQRERFTEYGKRVLELYKDKSHMYLSGRQCIKFKNEIISVEKHERVMVDYEGLCKYSSGINKFSFEEELVNDNIDEKDLLTIYPFAYIFNLGINKTWGFSHVKYLTGIEYEKDAFNYLVLEDKKKRIIKTLIKNHGCSSQYKDFINTKGNGLVFLLYGLPGTGKSFTAEATCELLERPLYSINVGDLGTDPEYMEDVMKTMLIYTKRWNAIVVIDEVDVFMEERETNMLIRNAMVGVFLKVLEYHDGIMFLTTNRLESLDAAIKSRINLMFPFEELGDGTRKQIWSSMLKNWKIDVTDSQLNRLNQIKLNGREIRNYMKLVFSLLEEDSKEVNGENIIKQLEELTGITEQFNKSIKSHSLYL